MNKHLYSFLKELRDQGELNTHVSLLIPNTGKYRIERQNTERFWDIYLSELNKEGNNFMCGLAERPRTYLPVLADIDIKVDNNESIDITKNLYTQKQVKQIIDIYLDILKYILVDYNPDDLTCFLLEKEKPYVSGCQVKNGFHLHFPFIFMSNVDQDIHLIPRVIRRVEEEKIFENLGITHSGEVIDKSCSKKYWLLYGSRKDQKLAAYKLSKVYNYKGNEISLQEAMKNQTLYDTNGDEINMEGNIEYYLPRILSLHGQYKEQYEAKNTIDIIPKAELQKAEQIKRVYENMTVSQALEVAKKLMPMLKPSRADSYTEWMEVGWILYNVGEGCQEALELWINFSRLTTKENFSEAECVFRWNKMNRCNYTIGSLKFFAKTDNPQLYNTYQLEEQKKLIMASLVGGHADIAKQLYDRHGNTFVCASVEKNIWFEFRNHKWVKVECGITLRTKISTEVIPMYVEVNKSFEQIFNDNAMDGSIQILDGSNKKRMERILCSLKSANFKDSILKECKELFYKENFINNLDTNPYLLGFNNGVLDLKTKEFRDGRPEDYITMTTGYDYKEFEEDDPEVIEVKDFLIKIFPNPVLRQHFMEYAAEILRAGNFSKTFYVMTGAGDNGKSVLIELLEKVLGEYMETLNPALITGKEANSSGATADLELTRGKRYIVLPEPSGTDVINPGILKRLTGNDRFYSRGLFKEGHSMVAMFKLCLICNKLPRITLEGSEAVWNRVRVLPFESRFPKYNHEVPLTFEEQLAQKVFYRDNDLSSKLPFMKQAMIWLMFQTYKYISKYGKTKEPEIVTSATLNYKETNDFYLQFLNEKTKEDRSVSNQGVTLVELYAEFRLWFANSFSGTKMIPSKNEFKEEMLKKWGPMFNNKWKNYRIRTIRDDEDEEKAVVLTQSDFTFSDDTEEKHN